MKAMIEIVHRDHTIKIKAAAVGNDGGGIWDVAIEEPGGRCIWKDVEIITGIQGMAEILSGLRCMINEIDDENIKRQ